MKTTIPSFAPAKSAAAKWTRRRMLQVSAGTAVGTVLWGAGQTDAAENSEPLYRVKRGRIHQSVMGWCFNPMPARELAQHCKELGIVAMEGVGAEHYPMIRELGLKISLVGSHGFTKGPFHKANHEMCIRKLREGIQLAAQVQCKNVITFTGMREPGVTDEQGAENCVACWKQIIAEAERKQINICLEHLNTRDHTHPMKGHPGYFGDNVDFCVDLIRRVDSPNMKLLFDIYHVQIMNGDVIRRIRQYHDVIAHYHTAGVPGRGELDENQELNYPAIMRAILETGYDGYVAQEFIPTWTDKIAALSHAVRVCDV